MTSYGTQHQNKGIRGKNHYVEAGIPTHFNRSKATASLGKLAKPSTGTEANESCSFASYY